MKAIAIVTSFIFCASMASAAIYGSDDRSEATGPLASAVAIQVAGHFIESNVDGSLRITGGQSLKRMGLCEGERFSAQTSIGLCTGFLLAPNLLVTAGHCASNAGVNSASEAYCEAFKWVFDYRLKSERAPDLARVAANRVYSCRRVIHAEVVETEAPVPLQSTDSRDFAVIELDRAVEGIEPLKLAPHSAKLGDEVFTIGHPWGMPAKHSGFAAIGTVLKHVAAAALDTQGGNSGGPVFNASGEVVGVLVGGYQFDTVKSGTCHKFVRCDERGQNCDRASSLFPFSEITKVEIVKPFLR